MPLVLTILGGIAFALIALFVWWWFFHISRPAVPPLVIAPDDPLMAAAVLEAKATLDRFQRLFRDSHQGARVKVPFVSNSGITEFLWAEVRALCESDVEVLYLTPPVTHTGRLECVHTHPISDLVDWQIELESGLYEGGFTMRAMFVLCREQWGALPAKLEREERKYTAPAA